MRDERQSNSLARCNAAEMQVGIEAPTTPSRNLDLHAAWEDQPCPSLDE